jgi:hypothetical protein
MSVALVCHPSTPAAGVRAITVRVSRSADGVLGLVFRLDAELARIRVPDPRPPRLAHQLWEHTCFEAFLAADGGPAYHELNFSPSGEWAGYAFRAYREVDGLADAALAPGIVVGAAVDHLAVETSLALARLSPAYAGAVLHLGLSAVIEQIDGTLSYWALHHPPGRPDFHHQSGWALRLEQPAGEW